MRRALFVLALLLAVFTRPAIGASWFVSPASPPGGSACSAGSNSNNGTAITTPFLTLQKAHDSASAGDEIRLCPGTYGGFTISKSGTSGAPIRLTSYSVLTQAVIDPQAGYVQDVLHHACCGIDTTSYDLILVSGARSRWTFDYLKFNNSSSTLATLLALNYDASNTANRATLISHLNDAGLWGGLMTIQQPSLSHSDHFVFDHLTIERMGFLGGDSDDLTFSNNIIDGHGFGVSGWYFDYYIGFRQDFHDNTYSNYTTFVHHFNGCNGTPSQSVDGNFYRESYSNIGNWSWQGLNNSWNVDIGAYYVCNVTLNGTVNFFDSTFYNFGYGKSAGSAYSGASAIHVNLGYSASAKANIINNTFHRVHCPTYLFVTGPSYYSNNLVLAHEVEYQNTVAGDECFDGSTFVTKQTNILSGSTSLLTSGDSSDLHLSISATGAIDAGTDMSSIVSASRTDRDGITRPQGLGWDIGGYESQTTPSTSQRITFVQFKDAVDADGGTSLAATLTSNTANGNGLVACTFWINDVTVSSIASSAGTATFTDVGSGRLARPDSGYLQCFLASAIIGGTAPTLTVNFSGATAYTELYVAEYHGIPAVTPIVDAYATGTATSGTTVVSGSLASSATNGMTVAFAVTNVTSGSAVGFTNRSTMDSVFADKAFSAAQGNFTVTTTWGSTLSRGAILAFVLNAEGFSVPVFNSIFFPAGVRGIAP